MHLENYWFCLSCWPPLRTPTLPTISSSAQYDFFPLAASSLDIIVYIRLGSGGSYFSLGIPVILKHKHNHFHRKCKARALYTHEAACTLTGNRLNATVQRTGEMPRKNDTEYPRSARTQTKAIPKSIAEGIFPLRVWQTEKLARGTTSLRFSNVHKAAFKGGNYQRTTGRILILDN